MKLFQYISICLLFSCYSLITLADINSLKLDLEKVNNDSTAILLLNQLANEYRIKGDLELAKFHAESALSKANNLFWDYGKAKSLNNLSYIGIYESNFEEAMENAISALKIAEPKNDEENLGFSYLYIGFINQGLKEMEDVIHYYRKSLSIRKRLNNAYNLGFTYSYMGNYFGDINQLDSCIYYHKLALETRLKTKDVRSIADSYLLIGAALFAKKEYKKAIKNYDYALSKYEEINDKRRLAEAYRNYAEIWLAKTDYDKAESYLTKAEMLAKEIGAVENLIPIYNEMAFLSEQKQDFKGAYYNVRKRNQFVDSINSNKVYREATKQILKYKLEKEKKIKELQLEQEKAQQQLISITACGVLGLVICFLLFVFHRLKITKQQKDEIDAQKQEIELTHEQLAVHHREIQDSISYAKRIQDAIMPSLESVHKALVNAFVFYQPKDVVAGDFFWMETIDSSLEGGLKEGEDHNTNSPQRGKINPISSEEPEGIVYFAAADCTGHGVPGAMISVVCSNALSKSLLEEGIRDTGKLLDRTRELVISQLAKSGEEVQEGMDISLCRLELKKLENPEPSELNKPANFPAVKLQWSGANNPLWIVRSVTLGVSRSEKELTGSRYEQNTTRTNSNFELIEYKPDKQPVGISYNPTPFISHNINLQKGDTIYVFSDGFQDQFGGGRGKKYKPNKFKEFLLSIQKHDIPKQKELIIKEFNQWKGSFDQIDDVCVIGVKV